MKPVKFFNLFNITPKGFIQSKKTRNRTALNCLKELGFSLPKIRKALIDLNGINISALADGRISGPTLYNTLRGVKCNETAQVILAEGLDLTREELFPSDNGNRLRGIRQ